ncbi:dephospho-CoA kinase [Arcanobacterium bovis]|uniref:dephospho-CoA kinase n=1 Tax=Arcanobacterium bovis TaxID=2529275 RepID=UPI0013F15BF2|nr:dephospho-CoA kinase [Arcanobacterium bovis]
MLALTGGIAAGKSYFARALADRGAQIIDYDVLARRAVEPGSPALNQIIETWGSDVLSPSGTLNRQRLAQIVFSSPHDLSKLNAITHPYIGKLAREAEQATYERNPNGVVVHDIPLLKGSDVEMRAHGIVVIDAREEVRVERMIRERSMSEDDARSRIARQLPAHELHASADVIVDNTQPKDTDAVVSWLWDHWINPFTKNLACQEKLPYAPASRPDAIKLVANTAHIQRKLHNLGISCDLAESNTSILEPVQPLPTDYKIRLHTAGFVPVGEHFEIANPANHLSIWLNSK